MVQYSGTNEIFSRGATGIAHGLSNSTGGAITMPHSTPVPYFPQNLEDYAPWVAIHGLAAPYGQCQCGCGGITSLSNKKDTKHNMRKGDPLRYVYNHSRRIFPPPPPPNPSGLCMCGCGRPTRISTATNLKAHQVKGQALRYIPEHIYVTTSKPTLEIAFWENVSPGDLDACWEWQGTRNKNGYGKFVHTNKVFVAHRVFYMLHYDPIPDGLWVLHKCDNRPCVNPNHLFLGTAQDNVDDMMAKGRGKGGFMPGESHPSAKLTLEKVEQIRLLVNSGVQQTDVAAQFGVAISTINDVVHGRSWRQEKAESAAHALALLTGVQAGEEQVRP